MKNYFILSVDTEADNQWDRTVDITLENLGYIERLQNLCNDYNIIPNYLLTYEVISNIKSAKYFKILKNEHKIDLGVHFHVWTTPPFFNTFGLNFNDPARPIATDLPANIFKKKLENITKKFIEVFGFKPLVFRSGRYGFEFNIAEILLEFGYKIDTSITPKKCWTETGKSGLNFSNFNSVPFMIKTINGVLWEMPITIVFTNSFISSFNFLKIYWSKNNNLFIIKLLNKLFFGQQPKWLRPFPFSNVNDLIQVIEASKLEGNNIFVMIFHSSELMPGGSPYWKSNKDVDNLYELLNKFFNYLQKANIESISYSKAYSIIKKEYEKN